MTSTQMPMWLVDQLDADGVMDKSTRLTRKPKPRRCPKCRASTLAAVNDLGIPTHLDPAPLTNAGEMFALLAARTTYATDHGEIYTRDHTHIRGRPADTHPVWAEHACGQALPSRPAPATRTVDYDQPPPF